MTSHKPAMAHWFTLMFLLLVISPTIAQVGIGTAQPDASSILDITSTNKGILVPRIPLADVSLSSLDGINTNALGLMIFNTNPNVTGGTGIGHYFWDGSSWDKLASRASNNSWSTDGNEVSGSQYLGSTNNESLRFKVNGVAAGSIDPNGSLSLGTNSSASAPNSIAIGDAASAQATNSVAIGKLATATIENTIILGDNSQVSPSINVGIGTNSPTAKLQVNGSLRLVDSSPGDDEGKFLKADAQGNASWQSATANKAYGELYRNTDLTPSLNGNYYISGMSSDAGTLKNVTPQLDHLVVTHPGIYKISYSASIESLTILDRTADCFIGVGQGATPTIINKSTSSAGTTIAGGVAHLSKTIITNLNAGDQVYLGYYTKFSGLKFKGNTISLTIEKMDY